MSDLQITGFEIIEKLGEGGMASVWKARQLSLDRIVAIKILSPTFAATPEDIEMFQKEAQQAAKLKHLGIVQVYDANAENGNYFFVMEYVAGYTVGTWLERKGALSEKNCLLVAECVADALEYAWNNSSIIHCDIKPDNVMIDDDGTVKVTDLGLARTISAMSEEDDVEDVMGTPPYISPEQALGKSDIDFHADIYSLGATLYHLSTGTMMFEDHPDENVMELQVNSSVPDALDLQPSLSKPFCFLLEKMLAKDPLERASDWSEIRKDITRVKKNMRPTHCLNEQAVSSLQRSEKRTKSARPEHLAVSAPQSSFPLIPVLGAVAVVIIAAVAFAIFSKGKGPAQTGGGTQPHAISPKPIPNRVDPRKRELQAKNVYDAAIKSINENPTQFREGLSKLKTVEQQTRGTKYTFMAVEQAKQLKLKWQNTLAKVMAGLEGKAKGYVDSSEFLHAAGMYERYSGPFAADTASLRSEKAEELRAMKKSADANVIAEKKRIAQKYNDTLDALAETLTQQGVEPALEKLRTCLYDKDLAGYRSDLEPLRDCLQSANEMDDRILASFSQQRGQTIVLGLAKGSKKVILDGVKDDNILTRQQFGSSRVLMSVSVKIDELSVKERLARMGDDSFHEVALVKGLMALKSGSTSYAKSYFMKTHPLIAERLAGALEGAVSKNLEDSAKADMLNGLASLGVKVAPEFDAWLWGAAVEEAAMSAITGKKAAVFAQSYRTKYSATQFGKKVEPILELLAKKQGSEIAADPAAPPRVTPNAPSRLEDQITGGADNAHEPVNEDALYDELLRKNRDLIDDEITMYTDSNGHIFKIQIISEGIQDISPLSKCKSLRELRCSTVWPGHRAHPGAIAPLSDLAPLKLLPLQKLYLGGTSVRDISPLGGLKLLALDLQLTKVSSLTPLKNMNLAYLNLENTAVKDIACLIRMELEEVNCSGTKIFNFKPLARKPIRKLLLNRTQFKDLSMVRTMPLKELGLAESNVSSFISLKGMQIDALDLSGTQIKDLSVLRGMNIKRLGLDEVRVAKYDVLAGMPLESVSLEGSSIKDIACLEGATLRNLNISRTSVSDLSPVKNMPNLSSLNVSGAKIKTFDGLADCSLRSLSCRGFGPGSLRALIQMRSLTDIWMNEVEGEMWKILPRIRGLERVNGQLREPRRAADNGRRRRR